MTAAPLELVCPAGNLAALRAAIDAGADVVYAGFADQTNARNFPGLNFSRDEMADGIAYERDGINYLVVANVVSDLGITQLNHEDYGPVPGFAIPEPGE